MLPPFTQAGDLPAAIHPADWKEVERHFGSSSEQRVRALGKLRHLYELAGRTGGLKRFLVFGSFVSTIAEPRDVDVALVMAVDFRLESVPRESRTLFSHADAQARFGASVFWVREGMLPEELMQSFLQVWQRKRDGTERGTEPNAGFWRSSHDTERSGTDGGARAGGAAGTPAPGAA